MSSKLRWSFGIAALALVVVGLAWLRREPRPALSEALGAPASEFEPAASAEALTGDAGEVSRAPLAVAAVEPTPQSEPDAAPGTATLVVRVVRARDGEPVAGAKVSVPADDTLGGWGARTDADGSATLAITTGVDVYGLVVDPERDPARASSVQFERVRRELEPFVAGERRTLQVEVHELGTMAFFGLVVDGASGQPIAGARVLDEARASGEKAPLVSDEDGTFHVTLTERSSVPLRIEAEGYGLEIVVAKGGYERPENALRIQLDACAELHVVVRGAPPAANGVRLSTKPHDLQQRDGSTGMGIFQLDGEEQVSWKASFDEHGACTFDCLPAGVPLAPRLAGMREAPAVGEELVLEPGERRSVTWDFSSVIRGRVIDQHGAAVAETELWLLAETRGDAAPAQRMLSAPEKELVSARATSDAQGAFELHGVRPGSWWVGARPKNAYDARDPLHDASSSATLVHVTDPGVYACDVVVWRGLVISGVVRAPDALPYAKAYVVAFDADSGAYLDAQTDEHGAFTLGPLAPGRYQLQADAPRVHVTSEMVWAEAGDTGVELALRTGGTLSGRVVDVPAGTAKLAFALAPSLGRERPDQGARMGDLRIAPDGSFSIGPLEAGGYDLAVRGPGASIGVVRAIEIAAGETTDVVLSLVPGATLRIRYEGIEPYAQLAVWSDDVQVAFDGIQSGTELASIVPSGEVQVKLRDQAGRSAERTVRIEAGATEEVALRLE